MDNWCPAQTLHRTLSCIPGVRYATFDEERNSLEIVMPREDVTYYTGEDQVGGPPAGSHHPDLLDPYTFDYWITTACSDGSYDHTGLQRLRALDVNQVPGGTMLSCGNQL